MININLLFIFQGIDNGKYILQKEYKRYEWKDNIKFIIEPSKP